MIDIYKIISQNESEIECIAKTVNIDKELIKSAFDGKLINEDSAVTVQFKFVADGQTENKAAIIFVKGTMIVTSQCEIAADNIINQGIDSIYELINKPGYINLDFADVMSVIGGKYAYTDTGYGKGAEKIETATKEILSSPQLKNVLPKSKGMIVCLKIDCKASLDMVDKTLNALQKGTHADAILFGVIFDDNFDDEIKLTVIATD